MTTEYHDAIAAYLRERDDADAEIKAATDTYRAETAALEHAAAEARAERDDAEAARRDAADLAAETDRTAAALWRSLGDLVGHRRTGPTPSAEPDPDPEPAGVRARLRRADRLLTLARSGELPIEAPRHTELGAAGIGAALSAAAVALAAWLLAGDLPARHAAAALGLFAGIAAGPLALGLWLGWQYRVRPRPGQIIACVAGAVTATCGLAALFLRGM
ncbi:hypothetical protein [Glycomyces xiaoerkulensis]|uniref:hypothetical protein n=1 Tax=Glycomyces xiaoerkulensis TaxID=2038139 RepID=UPI000C25BAC4|nr:hypothetical protein [Glycomyces xiaoerkulensis]